MFTFGIYPIHRSQQGAFTPSFQRLLVVILHIPCTCRFLFSYSPLNPFETAFGRCRREGYFFQTVLKKGVLFRLYKEGVFSGHGKRLFPNEKCFQIMKDFQIMKERCFSGHGSSDHGKGDPLLFQIHCKDCHFHDVADADDLQGMLDEAA